jgi:peptidoglycan hydrolase-like protein with peptidoglycan-binding domain
MPTLGDDTGNVNCSLGLNNHSDAVLILQINLNDCYWSGSSTRGHASAFSPALKEDSDFGPKTKAALKAAQTTVPSISHDGMYGPQTRANILFFADDGQIGRCAKFGS